MYLATDATVFSYDNSIARVFSDVLVPLGYSPIHLLVPPPRLYLHPSPLLVPKPSTRALALIQRDLYSLLKEPSSLYVLQLDHLDFALVNGILAERIISEESRFYGYTDDADLIERIKSEHDFKVHKTNSLLSIFERMGKRQN